MAIQTGVDARVTMPFPDALSKIDQTFPKPVLEHSEMLQFNEIVEKQDQTLASYDWVDKDKGIVRNSGHRTDPILLQYMLERCQNVTRRRRSHLDVC